MSVTAILLSKEITLALSVYCVCIVAVEVLVNRLHQGVTDIGITAWMVEHIALPLARAAVLSLFVLIAYPALFGLEAAPPLAQVLFAENGRLTALVNLAFVISLLLPLLPFGGRRQGLILPLQGIALSMLLFNWTATAIGIDDYSYWPGTANAVAVIAISLIAPQLAHHISHWLGAHVDRIATREGFEDLVFEGLLLFLQAPAIIVYSLSLGRQLTPG